MCYSARPHATSAVSSRTRCARPPFSTDGTSSGSCWHRVLAIVEVQAAGYSLSLRKAEFLSRYACCARLDADEKRLLASGLTEAQAIRGSTDEASTADAACTALLHACERTLRASSAACSSGGVGGAASMAVAVEEDQGWLESTDVALGYTKVFLRERVVRQLEGSREAVAALAAGVMQRIARAYLARTTARSKRRLVAAAAMVLAAAGAAATRDALMAFEAERARAYAGPTRIGGWAEGEGAALQALLTQRQESETAAEREAAAERAAALARVEAEARAKEKAAVEKAAAEEAARVAAAAEQAAAAEDQAATEKKAAVAAGGARQGEAVVASPCVLGQKKRNSVLAMASKFNAGEAAAIASPSAAGNAAGGGACDNYRIDLTGAKFGVCRCGFPKAEHKLTAERPHGGASGQPRIAWRPKQMKLHSSDGPQSAVSMRRPRGGDGPLNTRVQAIHEEVRDKVEAAVVDAVVTSKPARWSAAEHTACDNYRLDMAAERFGDCKCGRPKSEHKVTSNAFAPPPKRKSSVGIMGERQALLGAMFNPAMLQPGGRPSARQSARVATATTATSRRASQSPLRSELLAWALLLLRPSPSARRRCGSKTTMRASRRHRRHTRVRRAWRGASMCSLRGQGGRKAESVGQSQGAPGRGPLQTGTTRSRAFHSR